MIEIRASYDGFSENMDDAAHNAAGRVSDFSGFHTPTGYRELGWVCDELEAQRIKSRLTAIGMNVYRGGHHDD